MIDPLGTAFFFGMAATISPCVLPLYPGFLAYLSSQRNHQPGTSRRLYFSGLFVLLGVLSMMLILGAVIAALSVSIGRVLSWLVPLADLIIILLGVMMVFHINPFGFLPQIRSPRLNNPLSSAFLYGFLYAPLTMPCSGPLVVGIFAYSFTAQEAVSKLAIFLSFGLGFGLPLFIISLLSGLTQRWLVRFLARHAGVISLTGGLLLMAIGIYDLVSNWPNLLLYWS